MDVLVNVKDFGAVADSGGTDNLTAFNKAIAQGVALNRPIYVPGAPGTYGVSQTISPTTGIIGDGKKKSRFSAAVGSSTYFNAALDTNNGRSPILRMGWKAAENSAQCVVPMHGIGVVGPCSRPATRSSNPADLGGWQGYGILFDEMAATMEPTEIAAESCYAGIVIANNAGHINFSGVVAPNNWFGVYMEYGSGDHRFINCDLTGNLMASFGSHSTNKIAGLDVGGFVGLTLIATHLGFSPYAFWQPHTGTGTVGMIGCTLIDSRAEQIGNAWYQGGGISVSGAVLSRTSRGLTLLNSPSNWTDSAVDLASYNAYTIIGDGNFPIREATKFGLGQGAPFTIIGQSLARGQVSGVDSNSMVFDSLLAYVVEQGSPGYVTALTQGKERILGIRQSLTYGDASYPYKSVAAIGPTVAASEYSLGLVSIPVDSDNNPYGRFCYSTIATNAGAATTASIKLYLNGVDQGVVKTRACPTGDSNFDVDLIVSLGGRVSGTHTVELKLVGPAVNITLAASKSSLEMLQTGVV